jgi:hypothetical protein
MNSGRRRLLSVALRQAIGTRSLQHKQACLDVLAVAVTAGSSHKTASWLSEWMRQRRERLRAEDIADRDAIRSGRIYEVEDPSDHYRIGADRGLSKYDLLARDRLRARAMPPSQIIPSLGNGQAEPLGMQSVSPPVSSLVYGDFRAPKSLRSTGADGQPLNFAAWPQKARESLYSQLHGEVENSLNAEAYDGEQIRAAAAAAAAAGLPPEKFNGDLWLEAQKRRGQYKPYEPKRIDGQFDLSNMKPEERSALLQNLTSSLGYEPGFVPDYMKPPVEPLRPFAELEAAGKAANKDPIYLMTEDEMRHYYPEDPEAIAEAMRRKTAPVEPVKTMVDSQGVPPASPPVSTPTAAPAVPAVPAAATPATSPAMSTAERLRSMTPEQRLEEYSQYRAQLEADRQELDNRGVSDFDTRQRLNGYLGAGPQRQSPRSMSDMFAPGVGPKDPTLAPLRQEGAPPSNVGPSSGPTREGVQPPSYTYTPRQQQLVGGRQPAAQPAVQPVPQLAAQPAPQLAAQPAPQPAAIAAPKAATPAVPIRYGVPKPAARPPLPRQSTVSQPQNMAQKLTLRGDR